VRNCRAFFDNYAREKEFDPLDVETWENMDLQKLLAQEVSLLLLVSIQEPQYFTPYREVGPFKRRMGDSEKLFNGPIQSSSLPAGRGLLDRIGVIS